MKVLTINCGSSSLKFDLRKVSSASEATCLTHGAIERIGESAELWLEVDGERVEKSLGVRDYEDAVRAALALLSDAGLQDGIDAVGHRVVHGGPRFHSAVRIDSDVLNAIEEVSELAPLHNRPALEAIHASRALFGVEMPMIAAFDTSFFFDLPDIAREYALPQDVRERLHIRRYGFHGLAHRYMIERYKALRSGPATSRLITLQLGSGCSAAASIDGRPVDTSMGFTPLEGLIMGTRSGDLDPMLPMYLVEQGMTMDEVEALLNKQSGLLGLSGLSKDMRELQAAAAVGDAAAGLAMRAFCYRIQKYVGSYMAALHGADAIVFGGGIGERSVAIRESVSRGFGWCGLELDPERNGGVGVEDVFINAEASRIEALVVHVDESSVIASDVFRLLSQR